MVLFPCPRGFILFGGDDGIRTHDPLLAGQVLSQLSYTPISLRACFSGFAFLLSYSLFLFCLVPENRTTSDSFDNTSRRCLFLLRFLPAVFQASYFLHRKEVIQPHLPIRLPCYDLTPIIEPTFGSALLAVRLLTSGVPNFHGLTGGVYKARERIHRGMLIRDY